ncbi:hypothetical protein A1Q2_05578 [Trichosporon asahii var. asahii CBS 8904]|uniref:Uncharacterized protein n=1 Tax=Trichosporon asahii var. asahii (strain CBS 8904) TaxID=1220162 RepID=K1V817_TRIAC|nr:hypothetical protein A1Q2_05578 [Trichosporon asahii var. asahii CBS 8904]
MVATIYQLTTIIEYGATRTESTAIATVSATGTLLGNAEAYTKPSTTYPEPTWRSSTTTTPPPHSVTEPPDESGDSADPSDPFDIDTSAVVSVPNAAEVTPYTFPKSSLQPPDKPVVSDEVPPVPPPVPPKPVRMPRPVPPRPIARTTLEKLEAEARRPSQVKWLPASQLERRARVERRRGDGTRGIEKRPDNLRVQNPDPEPDPTPPPYDPAWSEGRH